MEERAKAVEQKARTAEEKERTLQSLDQDLKKRKAKMDQLEQQLQRVTLERLIGRDSNRRINLCVIISNRNFCYSERWVGGQEVDGNAEDSGSCRERAGESERRVDQKLRRDRKVTEADADDSGRAEYQGEENQRTSRVSITDINANPREIAYANNPLILFAVNSKPHKPS